MPSRVPLLNNKKISNANHNILEFVRKFTIFSRYYFVSRIRFPFGFSIRMLFLLWCVCGGFLLHMLESSYLKLLVKPNYEKAVDTAQDVLDRGLTVIWFPGFEQYKENLIMQNLSKVTRDLAEMTYVAKVSISFQFATYFQYFNVKF